MGQIKSLFYVLRDTYVIRITYNDVLRNTYYGEAKGEAALGDAVSSLEAGWAGDGPPRRDL